MSSVKAVIVDFDGTLVDTFEANYRAYKDAFQNSGLELEESFYRRCFGLNFNDFMCEAGIMDENTRALIREDKKKRYPFYFEYVRVNEPLVCLINKLRKSGVKAAVASTSSRENMLNLLKYIHLESSFDLILSGESVSKGKPSPEVYLKAFFELGVNPEQVLIFEDSPFGLAAAEASGASMIRITKDFFE